jgi:hypothetical protein
LIVALVAAALLVVACTPPASPEATRQCTAADLDVTARWQGATGALAGGLRFEVTAPTACTLPGQLQLELLDSAGQPLAVDALAAPDQGSASVELQPAESAAARIVWRNWCGPPPAGPLTIAVVLPAEADPVSVSLAGAQSLDTPRCDAPTEPSTLAIGPLETAASN